MPVDRGAIDAQLREIGEGERWWEVREFRDLPYVLGPDERIRALVEGKLSSARSFRVLPPSSWLVVLTGERLLLLRMERYGRQQVDLPLAQITGVRHRTRLRFVQVDVSAGRRRYRLRVRKDDAFRFIGALSALLAPLEGTGVAGVSPSVVIPGPLALLSRLTAPPAPVPATRRELERLESTVERLEGEVEQLRQHVAFLENLLHDRAGSTLSLPRSGVES